VQLRVVLRQWQALGNSTASLMGSSLAFGSLRAPGPLVPALAIELFLIAS
jgi:hypothetical protein